MTSVLNSVSGQLERLSSLKRILKSGGLRLTARVQVSMNQVKIKYIEYTVVYTAQFENSKLQGISLVGSY